MLCHFYCYFLIFIRVFFKGLVQCVWNVLAHVQKQDFIFRRNRHVHLNRQGRQFSRLLAAEVCASVLVMLDTPHSEEVWEYWLHTPFASFPFTSPPMCHRVPSGFKRTLINSGMKTRCNSKQVWWQYWYDICVQILILIQSDWIVNWWNGVFT